MLNIIKIGLYILYEISKKFMFSWDNPDTCKQNNFINISLAFIHIHYAKTIFFIILYIPSHLLGFCQNAGSVWIQHLSLSALKCKKQLIHAIVLCFQTFYLTSINTTRRFNIMVIQSYKILNIFFPV